MHERGGVPQLDKYQKVCMHTLGEKICANKHYLTWLNLNYILGTKLVFLLTCTYLPPTI